MNTNKLDAVETEVEVEVEFSDEVADEIDDDVYSEVTDADIAEPDAADSDLDLEEPSSPAEVEAARTAAQAIAWFRSRNGSTAYQGYCERAVRLAWARKTHHASAKKHWNSRRDGVQHRDHNAPAGAFVFWNISSPHGHVGIADGKGGLWATSVNGKIGHATSLGYFRNYLGWKPGNSN